jgi:hypothetical protein
MFPCKLVESEQTAGGAATVSIEYKFSFELGLCRRRRRCRFSVHVPNRLRRRKETFNTIGDDDDNMAFGCYGGRGKKPKRDKCKLSKR